MIVTPRIWPHLNTAKEAIQNVKLVIIMLWTTYLFIKHISATTRDYTEETESTRTVYKFNEECEGFERLQ